ncbi:MAG: class I SAM-dependent methyltransferase [Planctomycetota bacterium]
MSNPIRTIWNSGASVYDAGLHNILPYQRSLDAVIDFLPKSQSLSVLDVGSGTGALSERILSVVPSSSVTCLDISEGMMDQCRRKLESYGSRVRFILADFMAWEPDQTFDAVVSSNALIYKGIDVGMCYSKYAKALKPGCVFLNSTVFNHKDLEFFSVIKDIITPPRVQPASKEETDFSQELGKSISHTGDNSLLLILSQQEHIDRMTGAGLKSVCVWQYLYQMIIMGIKEENPATPATV